MRKKSLFGKMEPFLYLLPALVFFLLFTYYPFVKTIYSSTFLVSSMGELKEFVGLENYIRVLKDPAFLGAIKNTFVYVLVSVPVSMFIALLLALVANKTTRSSSVYETMFAVTMAMSTSVCAMIFRIMYHPTLGILNSILHTNYHWLSDPKMTLFSISLISMWMNIGFNFLFMLAAVRSVPAELLESSTLEGAGRIRQTVSVILPIISPTIFFLICNALARGMMMSGLVIIMSDGGRLSGASTIISYMYSQSVLAQNYNNGYAAAVIAFALTFVLLFISFMFENKTVNYDSL